MKKSILKGTLLTDGFFCLIRILLLHSKKKWQFRLRNFWSRLKMAPPHCVPVALLYESMSSSFFHISLIILLSATIFDYDLYVCNCRRHSNRYGEISCKNFSIHLPSYSWLFHGIGGLRSGTKTQHNLGSVYDVLIQLV